MEDVILEGEEEGGYEPRVLVEGWVVCLDEVVFMADVLNACIGDATARMTSRGESLDAPREVLLCNTKRFTLEECGICTAVNEDCIVCAYVPFLRVDKYQKKNRTGRDFA